MAGSGGKDAKPLHPPLLVARRGPSPRRSGFGHAGGRCRGGLALRRPPSAHLSRRERSRRSRAAAG